MRNGLLVSRGKLLEFLRDLMSVPYSFTHGKLRLGLGSTYALDHGHFVLVGGLATFRVGVVSVAVLAVVAVGG